MSSMPPVMGLSRPQSCLVKSRAALVDESKNTGKIPRLSAPAFLRTFANQARFSLHSALNGTEKSNGERRGAAPLKDSEFPSDAPVRIGAFNRARGFARVKKRVNVDPVRTRVSGPTSACAHPARNN